MTGRMKPHAGELACKRGLPTEEKTGYAEKRETGQNPRKV